jgi:hypothetical protein
VSVPALSLAFFDPQHGLYGNARAGATMLFEGSHSNVLGDGPAIRVSEGGWRAELEGAFSLELEPVAEAARLGGVVVHVCTVKGDVGGREVSCMGTVVETHTPPRWEELDALRTISVLVDQENALLALARRPRGAMGHGEELIVACLIQAGELMSVEDAHISTVYDGDGRQRSAGLELWLPGEDFPRRGSGTVVAGSSLDLENLRVHAAVFRWRLEEREGIGGYEVMVREETPAAA